MGPFQDLSIRELIGIFQQARQSRDTGDGEEVIRANETIDAWLREVMRRFQPDVEADLLRHYLR